MEFRILGPLEVVVGREPLDLGGIRQRTVLAMLLLSAGSMVTVDRLLEAVYGENLPPTARSQLQISVSALRRLLASRGLPDVISTRAQGYVAQVGGEQLDWLRFKELTAAARAARDAGRLDQAVASYRDALRLWRGRTLDGIDSQLVQAAAARLDEQRIDVNEERLGLELDLGRHHELVGELTELVTEFPLREELRGQLMLALYRCGRTADALEVYRQVRQTLIDELGMEPGEPMRRLEHAILNGDPALDPPPGPVTVPITGPITGQSASQPVPRLLPADIADFTGRADQLSQVRRLLTDAAGEAGLAVPVVVITGKGGVGKTTLAVHAAHGMAGRFPGGQLFANLHGATAMVGPARVLERFLRALGMAGPQLPDSVDERAEAYRNLLAGRKALVVLDDAATEGQVAPLLPGDRAAAVIVTSRARLTGLAGAAHVDLDVLEPGSSVELLARILGAGRVQPEPGAAAAVAEHCGYLPLALRIAGARLAARPHWSIGQLASRLADETRRLDELRHGDLEVRASISLSYDTAAEKAQRLLRRLALLEAPVFSAWLAGPLVDQPPEEAADLLDDLVRARLAEPTGTGRGVYGQYRLHDLIRVFGRERLAAEETAADRDAALERALGVVLSLAELACRRYRGGDYSGLRSYAPSWTLAAPLAEQLVADPMAWFERERATLVTGVRQAARAGLTELCWSLALSAEDLFEARAYFDDWRETAEVALAAARTAQDIRGQAAMLYSRGSMHQEQQRLGQARRDFEAAERLFRDIGDDVGSAMVIRGIADLDRLSGRLEDATRRGEQALAALRQAGRPDLAAQVVRNLAQVKLELYEPDAAQELLADALALAQAAGNRKTEAQVLHEIGRVFLLRGDAAPAIDAFEQALAIVRDLSDLIGEAYVLQGIGAARLRQGELGQARILLRRALELARTLRERVSEVRALAGLSELALAAGDPGQAAVLARQAADISRDMEAPLDQARALDLLGQAQAALGDDRAAEAAAAQAAALRGLTG